MNEILLDAVGYIIINIYRVTLIEPLSKKVLVYKAKPDAFGYIQSKL